MFKKIKVDDKAVVLEWETTDEKQATIAHSLVGQERPLPAFVKALKAFVPLVVRACDLPGEWTNELTVRQVALSTEEKGGLRGIIVSCRVPVSGCKAPLMFNTPYLAERAEGAEGGKGYFDESWSAAIAEAEAEALRYRNGEREQAELELDAG